MAPRKLNIPFPYKGVNKNYANTTQPPLTSPDMKNVRAYDVIAGRIRGGQRPGLKKEFAACIGNSKPVVAMDYVTIVEVS